MSRDASPTPLAAPQRPPSLSVVIPLLDEEPLVPTLVDRLARALDALGVDAEVILVDDGSRDGTLDAIARAHAADPRFRGLSLSRNFGHQVAISAGLAHSRGASVVVMDGDLQDPPEAIKALWDRLHEGYDVVYAVRSSRPEGPLKRFAYHAFYRLLARRVDSIHMPLDAGDFGIMSRRVVDLLVAMPERRRYVRGLRAWVGFRQAPILFDRARRHSGTPKFTPAKLLNLAFDALIGFGDAPLRWAGLLGLASCGVSVFAVAALVLRVIFSRDVPPGWAWIIATLGLLGGAQLICLAVLGEYGSRILQEVHGRPLYVVRDRIGLDPAPPPPSERP